MRTLATLLPICLGASVGLAAEPAKADLKFAAVFEKGELVIAITNPGDAEVAVITASPDMTYDDKTRTLTLGLARAKDKEGKVDVPSETELKIVKIKKGEAAKIVLGPKTDDGAWGVMAIKAAAEYANATTQDSSAESKYKFKLTVVHEVTEDWGKRFNVWSGKHSFKFEVRGPDLPATFKR